MIKFSKQIDCNINVLYYNSNIPNTPNTLDTLQIYERLKEAKLDELAAKEIAEVVKDVTQNHLARK